MGSTPLVGNTSACNPIIQLGTQQPGDFTTIYQRHNQGQCCDSGSSGNPLLDIDPPWATDPVSTNGTSQDVDDCSSKPGSKGNATPSSGLFVDGNTVTDGKYFIAACNENSGTLTVTNTQTGATFMVYGDPHIKTETGGTADFQHAPVTFKLPDGTEITVTPTNKTGPNSVNTIKQVTITKGNDAVTMTGFTPGSTGFANGNLKTVMHAGQAAQYEGNEGTLLTVRNGDLDDLVTADGTEIYDTNVGNIDNYANGDAKLSVNGNTVTDGRYTITANDNDSGTLTVKDTKTGETFTVWGDPHIKTSAGGTADFQHAPVTFKLPDGTEITVTPTNKSGVNTIDHVTVVKGHEVVKMTGFTNNDVDTTQPQYEANPDKGLNEGTVLHTKGGNIDDLVTADGNTQIYNKAVGNIDNYANGDARLSVNGNTVNDGRYVITATDVDHGTLTVKDTKNGETFTVWGDPHIKTSKGGTADFQHEPVTFKLPDGTLITVTPTGNAGVNTIKNVTVIKGDQIATMTGFTNNDVDTTLQTQDHPVTGINPGIMMYAKNGNIDDLVLPGGNQIYNKAIGNIDSYAATSSLPGSTTTSAASSDPNWVATMSEVDALEQQAAQLESNLAVTNGGSPHHHHHVHRPPADVD